MEIKQFDTDPVLMELMNKHMGWHGLKEANEMGFPKRAIQKGEEGSGIEFLTFHAWFLEQFFQWNNSKATGKNNTKYPVDLKLLAPWITLPNEIKTDAEYISGQYYVDDNWITNSPQRQSEEKPFNNSDELGIYLEGGRGGHDIHGFLHLVGVRAFGDIWLWHVTTSPRSTYFYQLHGYINYWWNYWYGPKVRFPRLYEVVKIIIKPWEHWNKIFSK